MARKRSRKINKKKNSKKYKSRRRSRKFGNNFDNNMGPNVYNVSQQKGGILLANDAFSWMGNPTARALMSGSG